MKRSLVFVLALMLSATGAGADRYSDCSHADPDRSIRGCTQIIERGKRESREIRSKAYNNRGNAYESKGELERAKVAFYWNADGIDENGSPTLADLQSTCYDRRSVAELITAVLALDKK